MSAQQAAPQPASANGQATSATAESLPPEAQAIVDANTLQSEGKLPFHLKMSFQIFNLDGKPSEQGTLEYWWAGADGFHLDISAPSFGTRHDVRLNEVESGTARRSLYLANELLDNMRFPGAGLMRTKGTIDKQERKIGPNDLECLKVVPTKGNSSFGLEPLVCTDGKTGTSG